MEEFYPSEIARLVLGYLREVKCRNSWHTFLEESSDLQEHCRLYKEGKYCSTNINGKSLLEILKEYCILKSESLNAEKQNKSSQNNSHSSEPGTLRTPSKVNQNSYTKFRINQKLQTQSVVSVSYAQDQFKSPSQRKSSFQSPTSRPGCKTPRRRLDCQTTPLNFESESASISKDHTETATANEGISSNPSTAVHGSASKRNYAICNENTSYSNPVVSSRHKTQDRIIQTDGIVNNRSRCNVDHRSIQTELINVPSTSGHSKKSELTTEGRSLCNTDNDIVHSTPNAVCENSFVNSNTTPCLVNSVALQERLSLQTSEADDFTNREPSIMSKNIVIQSSEITAHGGSITVSTMESSVTPQYLPDPPPYCRAPGTDSPRIILSYDRSQVPSLTTPIKDKRCWEEFLSPKRKGFIPRRRLLSASSPSQIVAPSVPTMNEEWAFFEEYINLLAPKIADNINKALGTEEVKDPSNSYPSLQDIADSEEVIQNALADTEADPMFDNCLSALYGNRDLSEGNFSLEASLSKMTILQKESETERSLITDEADGQKLITDEADGQKQSSKGVDHLHSEAISSTNELNFEQSQNDVNTDSVKKMTEESQIVANLSADVPDSVQLEDINAQIDSSSTDNVSKNSVANSKNNISSLNSNVNELINKSDPSQEKLNSSKCNSVVVKDIPFVSDSVNIDGSNNSNESSVLNSSKDAMEVDSVEMIKEVTLNNKELEVVNNSENNLTVPENNNLNVLNATNPESHVEPSNNQMSCTPASQVPQSTLVFDHPSFPATFVVSGFPLQNTMQCVILNPSTGYEAANNPIYLSVPAAPIENVNTNTAIISPSKSSASVSNLGTVGATSLINIAPADSLKTDNCITSKWSPVVKERRRCLNSKSPTSQTQRTSRRKRKNQNEDNAQQNSGQSSKSATGKRQYIRRPKRKLRSLFPSPPAKVGKLCNEIYEVDHPVISIPELPSNCVDHPVISIPEPPSNSADHPVISIPELSPNSADHQSAFEILSKISDIQSPDLKSLLSSAEILANTGGRLTSALARNLDFGSVSSKPNNMNIEIEHQDHEKDNEPSRRSLRIKHSKKKTSQNSISPDNQKNTRVQKQKNKSVNNSNNSESSQSPVKSDNLGCSTNNVAESMIKLMDDAREKYVSAQSSIFDVNGDNLSKSCEKKVLNALDKFVGRFHNNEELTELIRTDNGDKSSTCSMLRSEYFPDSDVSNSSPISNSKENVNNVQISPNSVTNSKSPSKVSSACSKNNLKQIRHQKDPSSVACSADSSNTANTRKSVKNRKTAKNSEISRNRRIKNKSNKKIDCAVSKAEKDSQKTSCNSVEQNCAELDENVEKDSGHVLRNRKITPLEEDCLKQQVNITSEAEVVILDSSSDSQKSQILTDIGQSDYVHSSPNKDLNLVKDKKLLDNAPLDMGIRTDNSIDDSAAGKACFKPDCENVVNGVEDITSQAIEKTNLLGGCSPKDTSAYQITGNCNSVVEFDCGISNNDSSIVKIQSKGLNPVEEVVDASSASLRKHVDLSSGINNFKQVNEENKVNAEDDAVIQKKHTDISSERELASVNSESSTKNVESTVKSKQQHNKVNLKKTSLNSNCKNLPDVKKSHSAVKCSNDSDKPSLGVDCIVTDRPELPVIPRKSKSNLLPKKLSSEGNDNSVSWRKSSNSHNCSTTSSNNSGRNFRSVEKRTASVPTRNSDEVLLSSNLTLVQSSSVKDSGMKSFNTNKQLVCLNEGSVSTNEISSQSAKNVPLKKRIRPVPVYASDSAELSFSPFMSDEIDVNAKIITSNKNFNEELSVKSNEQTEKEKSVVANNDSASNPLPGKSSKNCSSNMQSQIMSNSLPSYPVAHSPLKNIVTPFHSPRPKSPLSGKPKAMADFYRNAFPDKNSSLPISPVSFSNSSCTTDAFLAKRQLLNNESHSPSKAEQSTASNLCDGNNGNDITKSTVAESEEVKSKNAVRQSDIDLVDKDKVGDSTNKKPSSVHKQKFGMEEECHEETRSRKRKLSESYFSDTCSTLADCADLEIVTPEKDDSFYKSDLFSVESPPILKKRKKLNLLESSPEVTPEKKDSGSASVRHQISKKSGNPQIVFLKPTCVPSSKNNLQSSGKNSFQSATIPSSSVKAQQEIHQEGIDKNISLEPTQYKNHQKPFISHHNSANTVPNKETQNRNLVKNIPQNTVHSSHTKQRPAQEKHAQSSCKSLSVQSLNVNNKVPDHQDRNVSSATKDIHKSPVKDNERNISSPSSVQSKSVKKVHKTSTNEENSLEVSSINPKTQKALHQNLTDSSLNEKSHKFPSKNISPTASTHSSNTEPKLYQVKYAKPIAKGFPVRISNGSNKKVEESPVRSNSNMRKNVHKSALIKKTEQNPNFPAGVKLPSKWNSSKIHSYSNAIGRVCEDKKRNKNNNAGKKERRSRPTLKIATLKSPSKSSTSNKKQNSPHSPDVPKKEKASNVKTSKCDPKSDKQNCSVVTNLAQKSDKVATQEVHKKKSISDQEEQKLQTTQGIIFNKQNCSVVTNLTLMSDKVATQEVHKKKSISDHEEQKLQATQSIILNENLSSSKVCKEGVTSCRTSHEKILPITAKQQASNFIDTCENTRDIVEKDIGLSDEPGSEVANAIANLTKLHSPESPKQALEENDMNFSEEVCHEEDDINKPDTSLQLASAGEDRNLKETLDSLLSEKISSLGMKNVIALLMSQKNQKL